MGLIEIIKNSRTVKICTLALALWFLKGCVTASPRQEAIDEFMAKNKPVAGRSIVTKDGRITPAERDIIVQAGNRFYKEDWNKAKEAVAATNEENGTSLDLNKDYDLVIYKRNRKGEFKCLAVTNTTGTALRTGFDVARLWDSDFDAIPEGYILTEKDSNGKDQVVKIKMAKNALANLGLTKEKKGKLDRKLRYDLRKRMRGLEAVKLNTADKVLEFDFYGRFLTKNEAIQLGLADQTPGDKNYTAIQVVAPKEKGKEFQIQYIGSFGRDGPKVVESKDFSDAEIRDIDGAIRGQLRISDSTLETRRDILSQMEETRQGAVMRTTDIIYNKGIESKLLNRNTVKDKDLKKAARTLYRMIRNDYGNKKFRICPIRGQDYTVKIKAGGKEYFLRFCEEDVKGPLRGYLVPEIIEKVGKAAKKARRRSRRRL